MALAVGEDHAGDAVVVACSVGIALDLVPTAADGRLAIDATGGAHADTPPSQLILAVPERDDHPGTRRLAARLRAPATVVPVPGDWRAPPDPAAVPWARRTGGPEAMGTAVGRMRRRVPDPEPIASGVSGWNPLPRRLTPPGRGACHVRRGEGQCGSGSTLARRARTPRGAGEGVPRRRGAPRRPRPDRRPGPVPEVAKRYRELEPIVARIRELRARREDLAAAREMQPGADGDEREHAPGRGRRGRGRPSSGSPPSCGSCCCPATPTTSGT